MSEMEEELGWGPVNTVVEVDKEGEESGWRRRVGLNSERDASVHPNPTFRSTVIPER